MKILEITPAIATKMLEKNLINRPVSSTTVRKYADLMQKNMWHLNGDTIKLTKSGCLIDGQHRLYAIIKANKPTVTYIINDLDDSKAKDIFSTLDQGRARTVSDILSCNKVTNSVNVASAGRMLHWLENYKTMMQAGASSSTIPKYYLSEYIMTNADPLQNAVNKVTTLYRKSNVAPTAFASAFFAFLLKNNCPVAKVGNFFETFYLGKGEINEAPNTLRHFVQKHKLNKVYHSENFYRIFMTLSWNAYVKDKPVKLNLKQAEDLLFYPEIDIRS